MGMHRRLTFLLLLLSLRAPGTLVRAAALPDLPRVVALSEDAEPGSRVAEVTVSCTNASSSPDVTLHSTEPGHPFNPVAVSADPTAAATFLAEVTLRAGAQLDAHLVNQYNVTLRAACPGEGVVEKTLFVQVTAGQVLPCDAPFASAEGDVVQVLADVAPRMPLYAVLPQLLGGLRVSASCPMCPQPVQAGASVGMVGPQVQGGTGIPSLLPPSACQQFRLRNHNTPLTLTHQGLVLAPAGGFDRSEDNQAFRLEIEVMDRLGHNCSGAVTVEVLPPRRPRVTFPELQRSVTVPEGIGPLEVVTQVHASGNDVRYAILAPTAPALFTIDEVTGEIRSTRRLEVAHTHLLVRAYNALHPADHATATLNITVQGMDRRAPSCVPAIYVSQVSETVSPGSTLMTLRCTDPAGDEGSLRYTLEEPLASRFLFRMEGPQLQVNTTLDYDSEAAASVGFQFTATIVVTAGEQPLRSTHVPVLVTVTPVNEFTPTCPNGAIFTVLETAPFGSAVGRVAGTDRDYPPDSLEYSLEGVPGPSQPFSIDTHTGELRVVGPLDSQRQKSYRLVVRLRDTRNDLNPAKRWSSLCDVAVRLQVWVQAGWVNRGAFMHQGYHAASPHSRQAVPDPVLVCTPEVQELRITAGLGSRQPVTRLACQGSPDSVTLVYAITGGNEDGRFRLEGNTLFYIPDDLAEPRTYVLLVEVWGSPSARRRSTVVALVVHVTPRSTPVPPSTTARHTTPQSEMRIIVRTEAVWHPPAWFVAVLTISCALLLAALGCLARNLLYCNRDRSKLLLVKSSQDTVEQRGSEEKWGHAPIDSLGQFDGRAQDPCTGRDYLFNSVTGARRWI
ncbi:cadherin-related family member 4 isoform X2 [Cuculus canorus]|uniref:cadherin-related family member 4 isoform X2 n=1 Tax=Cuculus canorus TaxID=55661 RepID=UPI0023AA7806|nr:cadherin-related family member 4 isoform X2 [Cuculus canorus]